MKNRFSHANLCLQYKVCRYWKGMVIYMQEKRRSERRKISVQLEISSLFKQDNIKVDNIDAPIEIDNISKLGIGFRSKSKLPLDFYFNAKIQLGGEDSTLYAVLKIIRIEEKDDEFAYGAQFVGMPPVFDYIFDEYEENEIDVL